MENKLLDSYSASGTDAKSFISEMRDLAARTSYPFVDPFGCVFAFLPQNRRQAYQR